MGYISSGNDDSIPMKVKSQCVLLRANIDEFEKNIKSMNNRFPDENILKILDSTRPSMIETKNESNSQLKFYQTIVNELEFYQCSISNQNSNEMQQD